MDPQILTLVSSGATRGDKHRIDLKYIYIYSCYLGAAQPPAPKPQTPNLMQSLMNSAVHMELLGNIVS